MTWDSAFVWLLQTVFVTTLILAAAAFALRFFRQPADRSRLVQWSLFAAWACLPLAAVPQFSLFSLPVLGRVPEDNASREPHADPSPAAEPRQRTPVVPVATQVELHTVAPRPDRVEEPTSTSREIAEPIAPQGFNIAQLAARALCVAYATGAIVLLVRLLSAYLRLRRLVRSARPVPGSVRALLDEIAGDAAAQVRVLSSTAIQGPITFGVQRPVILLPESDLAQANTRLRYYLAHEWAHVSRHDALVWQFTSALQVLFYYQPLYWYLRQQLSVCLDQLADADAAAQGETGADYASFLVQLAREQQAGLPQLSLGIGSRGSSLRRRVVMLLSAARPRATCPRALSRTLGASAVATALFVSALRLDAEPAAAAPQPATEKALPAAITYDGTVIDAISGKPIPDVKVRVWRRDSSDWSDIEITDHTTDAEGRYSFTLPPEQVARDFLYLEVSAQHPNYAMKGKSGYSHDMIRKNLKLGEPPFYSKIRLWPGEAVTGTVVDPEGKPVAGAEVTLMARSDDMPTFRFTRERTKTDEQGNFRVVPPTPGNGALWIRPERFTPLAFLVNDRRGDWGKITVEKGADVPGKVVDQDGTPVAGVRVEARRSGDGPEVDKWLRANAVANNIGRQTVTAADGTFTLAALPDGEYTITIQSDSESYDPPPLPQVFLHHKFSIAGGVAPGPIEIRAVPHVTIKARYFDSAGKPRSGHDQTLFGFVDGGSYVADSSNPGKDGWFEIRAPRGLQRAEINLSTNEHSALRWRLGDKAPLMRTRQMNLGTLDKDLDNLEIIRYVAPVLLLKPVDQNGEVLANCEPNLTYTKQTPDDALRRYTVGNNVHLEHQPDGRWRSEQLLPDEPFTVAIEKNGFEITTTEELSLAEGEEREVTVVLKPKPADAPADAPSEAPAPKQ